MAIKLDKDVENRIIGSLQRYASSELDIELGNLQSAMLLDYVLKEIGPSIYNRAIRDATRYMNEKVSDMDANCYEPEFGYWKK